MPEFPNPLQTQNFSQLMERFFSILQKVAIAVLAVVLVYVGYLFSTSEGDPEKLERAKKAIFWTVVGAGIIFLAKPLVRMILNVIS